MAAFTSRDRPFGLETETGLFVRLEGSRGRSAPSEPASASAPRTETEERLRWSIAVVAMCAFPVAGVMHFAFGISPATYVAASVFAFGAFMASVTKADKLQGDLR